jgi:hypothetical protein
MRWSKLQNRTSTAQGSTTVQPDNAVLVVPSPHGVAPGYDYVVDDGEVTLHSDARTVGATQFYGFQIKQDSLWLFDRPSGTWSPWLPLEGMPEGVWVRFVSGQGLVLIPVELRRDPNGYSGRWLDATGRLLPLGTLDAVRADGGAAVLAAEQTRHDDFMDSWRRFGGWRLTGGRWYPPYQ